MKQLVRRLARLGGAPRATPVLQAVIDSSNPASQVLFEGDGRPRVVIDRGLNLLRGSRALGQLLGTNPARTSLADLFAPEIASLAVQTVEAAMRRGAPSQASLATLARHTDGTSRVIGLTVAPVREADGTISGAILVLEPTGPIATGEVQARKLQSLGALAGGIAHDFNNLLQGSC